METDSEETEFNEDGEPIAKRRKPVSLIKGRIPRQRAQTSRLKDDYVVPNKFASTTNLLSENQFRAFAKEQAKQNKKVPTFKFTFIIIMFRKDAEDPDVRSLLKKSNL